MQKTLKRSELEAQLEGKSVSITRRLEALQDEIGALSLRRTVESRPWISMAAAVAGGLLFGLLVGGIGKSRTKSSPLHSALVEGYIESIGEDVRRLTARGKEASAAVREALKDRVPVILYSPDETQSHSGAVRQFADLALKAAAGFAVKSAMDYAAARVDVENLVSRIVDDAESPGDGQSIPDVPVAGEV